ncbi:hypothetical protein [Paracoccus everestensis]|uniref:hypothetical protein n=1 Tax=Paracoccus everestensis TaxID=2903900 RepID=UPI001F3B9042|nr:hypothetical protein [Paracoccus everestensis]
MSLIEKYFSERSGNTSVIGSVIISTDGRVRVKTETEARNDLLGTKATVWVDIYNADGKHVFTSDPLFVWANARLVGGKPKSDTEVDYIPEDVLALLGDPKIDVVIKDRDNWRRDWEAAVEDAKHIVEDLTNLAGGLSSGLSQN